MELPSLRQVLTNVLRDIEESGTNLNDVLILENEASATLLTVHSLPETVRTSLIVLDQIYPQLLLSSLDLLDNSLVTRYTLAQETTVHAKPPPIYYVRSSQIRPSRYSAPIPRSVYEVRPAAWHCTCPSFTFSAFSSRNTFDPFERGEDDFPTSDRWGGEMRGGQLAICKHLLAVLIGDRLKVIPEKQVDMNTMANYAFGDA
jgi:hypothetical protein